MDQSYELSKYRHYHRDLGIAHRYLLPVVLNILSHHRKSTSSNRVFDLGCGNGSTADFLTKKGFEVIGIDSSVEGISIANQRYPSLCLENGSVYDDLRSKYGRFPFVISLEVVEHLYSPRKYASTVFDLLEDGGCAIVSTPYHGYIKNVVLAISGALDDHFTALWDGGHIKFWSIKTLTRLLTDAGFKNVMIYRVGRIPALAKSMIAVSTKRSC